MSPRKLLTALLSLLLGLALGIGIAFVRRALDQGVEDPEVVERTTGVAVYATVPHSVRQDQLLRKYRRDRTEGRPVLAAFDPEDIAVEAIRSLRTALQFSLLEARSNVVTVVGATPSAGKSFVAANLAYVLADAGKRVLLVDADLRKGRLHQYFDTPRARGLSEMVMGSIPFEEGVRRTSHERVRFIPTGALPPNPSEMLHSEHFRNLAAELARSHDIVVYDTPPILAVADGAIVGRNAGVNLLVLRAGRHPIREIALAAKRFRQNGVQLHGAIMNAVTVTARSYNRYGHHYQYEYKRDAGDDR